MTDQSPARLAACPFCGGIDVRVETHEHSRDWETNYVVCDCGAEGPAKGSRDWAISLWNRRAPNLSIPSPAIDASGERVDAARYRWLRENACHYSDGLEGPELAMRTHGPDWQAQIDAAIDSVMAQSKGTA